MWKIAEAYTNDLDTVKIAYIYLHVLDPVEPLLCEPMWKIAEAYTNDLDTVKIAYIHMYLIQLRPLLSEPNVENCRSIY
jgi:hypothetical protein